MKKSLLFVAAFITAMICAKAQDSVTWMAAAYCDSLSIAADGVALAPNQDIVRGSVTFTAMESGDATDATKGWLYKTSDTEFTFNGVTYTGGQVQGQTNPLNGRLLRESDEPAIAKFVSTSAGRLDVAFKFGYNKRFWVAAVPTTALLLLDGSDSTAVSAYKYEYETGSYYWSGYLDPTTIPCTYYDGDVAYETAPEASETVSYYSGITLDVKTDYTYFVFFSGSKLMLAGFTFVKEAVVVTEYSISGSVKTSDGTAIEGVLITSSDSQTATTDASGAYSFTGITAESITLTPSKTDYTFSPETLTLTMTQDYTAQDFVGTPVSNGINDVNSKATVVSTVYYSMNGQKLTQPKLNALNIVVKTMSTGAVITEKQYIKE